MAELIRHRYRLVFLMGTQQLRWLDYLTGSEFSFPAGVDLEIEIAIASKLRPLTFYDATNLASAHLVIKAYRKPAPSPEDPTLGDPISGTIGNRQLTRSEWVEDSAWQLTFSLSSSRSNLRAGKYWLGMQGTTTDGKLLSIGWGVFNVDEDGIGPTATVTPVGPSYYSADVIDAKLETLRSDLTVGLPTGGQPGELLIKTSADDFDAEWQSSALSWTTNDW